MLQNLRDDSKRTWVANAFAFIIATIVLLPSILPLGEMEDFSLRVFVPFYLVFWISSSCIYIWMTHRILVTTPPEDMRTAEQSKPKRTRMWHKLLGYSSETSFALQAAFASVVLTIAISRISYFDDKTIIILLTLVSVACSWVLAAQAFASSYYRLWLRGELLDIQGIDEPNYSDFWNASLTFSSQFGTTVKFGRAAQRILRNQSIIFLFFNGAAIALVVALLLR